MYRPASSGRLRYRALLTWVSWRDADEQGSESDEAPIVSLEDYALQPGQAHQGAIVPIAAPPAQPQAATDKKAIAGDKE